MIIIWYKDVAKINFEFIYYLLVLKLISLMTTSEDHFVLLFFTEHYFVEIETIKVQTRVGEAV